jgi:hypothetical protein
MVALLDAELMLLLGSLVDDCLGARTQLLAHPASLDMGHSAVARFAASHGQMVDWQSDDRPDG